MTKIRHARESRGLTRYALAKAAGIPNQATIRDAEQGKDVKSPNLQAVADALGLELGLVESCLIWDARNGRVDACGCV